MTIILERGQVTAMLNYLKSYSEMMAIDVQKSELLAQLLPSQFRQDMKDNAETTLEHLGYFAEMIEQLETALNTPKLRVLA